MKGFEKIVLVFIFLSVSVLSVSAQEDPEPYIGRRPEPGQEEYKVILNNVERTGFWSVDPETL